MVRFLCIVSLTALLVTPARAVGLVQINAITDLNLGSWGIGDPAVSSYIDVCIAATATVPSSQYAITATGSSGFTLTSGSNHIPYSLTWEDSGAGNLGTSPGTALSNGVLLDSQANAYILSAPFCATGNNARLHLKIAQTDMIAALAGTYTGTITLMVSPP
jgi:hypothetical protein